MTGAKPTKVRISTVTPVYSGAEYLGPLVGELEKLRAQWLADDAPVVLDEAIFVDDAAIDDSPEILDALAAKHEWVRVLHLSRNFGQHPATIAGVLHSSGSWLVTLDEDLQHRPRDIPELFREALESRRDIVYANPRRAVHENWVRDLGSRAYKYLMTLLTGNENIRLFNSFRLMRGPLARAAASVCAHETYFDIALSWFTQRVGAVKLDLKDERVVGGGASGYSLHKLLSHARRMAVSSQTKIIRGGALVGGMSLAFAAIYGTVVAVRKLADPESIPVQGWTSLFLAILFFGGIISFLLGVVIEYLAVILLHAQGKPTFFTVDRSSDETLFPYFVSDER